MKKLEEECNPCEPRRRSYPGSFLELETQFHNVRLLGSTSQLKVCNPYGLNIQNPGEITPPADALTVLISPKLMFSRYSAVQGGHLGSLTHFFKNISRTLKKGRYQTLGSGWIYGENRGERLEGPGLVCKAP